MPEPLVSVIVNNFNYGAFLREAIDSALAQTYTPLEVIVVDDGSTDESRAIIASYGRHVVPVLKENGGQASAINAGYAISRGDWICLLDSDDVWAPTKVTTVMQSATAARDAALIYHRIQPTDMHGALAGRPRPHHLFCGDVKRISLRAGGWWDTAPSSALCFRRDVMERLSPIPEQEFRICADVFLVCAAPFFGQVVGLPGALTHYRIHGNNYWSVESGRSLELELIRKRMERYATGVFALNQVLNTLGCEEHVCLADHYPFQRLRWQLGEGLSLSALSWLALRCPGNASAVSRVRHVVSLWRHALAEWRR